MSNLSKTPTIIKLTGDTFNLATATFLNCVSPSVHHCHQYRYFHHRRTATLPTTPYRKCHQHPPAAAAAANPNSTDAPPTPSSSPSSSTCTLTFVTFIPTSAAPSTASHPTPNLMQASPIFVISPPPPSRQPQDNPFISNPANFTARHGCTGRPTRPSTHSSPRHNWAFSLSRIFVPTKKSG